MNEYRRTNRKGDEITHRLFNEIKREIDRNRVRIAGAEQLGCNGANLVRIPQSQYIIKTPVGGIPARVGTTAGSAQCDVWQIAGDGTMRVGSTHTVFNVTGGALAGNKYGGASIRGGQLVCDFLEC